MDNKQYPTLSRQSGMAFVSWVIVLVIAVCVVMVAFRTIPVYLTAYKIAGAMQEIQKQPDLQKATLHELRSALQRRLDINSVNFIKAKSAKITLLDDGDRIFSLPYKRSKPLIGNAKLVFTFNPEAHLEGR